MSELFDIPESLSPKLKWCREHGISTIYYPELEDGEEESPETGERLFPWTCDSTKASASIMGKGETEEDAIWDYCRKNGLPHYSHETKSR